MIFKRINLKVNLTVSLSHDFLQAKSTLTVKNGRYEIDLRDNVYYFPVIQSRSDSAMEACLIE